MGFIYEGAIWIIFGRLGGSLLRIGRSVLLCLFPCDRILSVFPDGLRWLLLRPPDFRQVPSFCYRRHYGCGGLPEDEGIFSSRYSA